MPIFECEFVMWLSLSLTDLLIVSFVVRSPDKDVNGYIVAKCIVVQSYMVVLEFVLVLYG